MPVAPPSPDISFPFSIETRNQLHPALDLEWLLTNGLGGYASSTVSGCNTRRYHGLLCAALIPPVGRLMALNRVGELIYLDGDPAVVHEFSINQFRQDFHPRGDRYLVRFDLGDTARWEFNVEGITIRKELQIAWHENRVGLRYTLESAKPRKFELRLLPFVSLRDFHALRRSSSADLIVAGSGRQRSISAGSSGITRDARITLHLQADAGEFEDRPDWWYGQTYSVETQRGQDDTEDLLTPGPLVYSAETAPGQPTRITLWASMAPPEHHDWDEELHRRPKPSSPAAAKAPSNSMQLNRLARGASDFIVQRGQSGTSVIAGYPWFADWGRDTMISLPGLFLTTGRFDQAAGVLKVFAQHIDQGMIPNRFDDYTNTPHYNTVDASLWFIHAAFEFARLSGDKTTFENELRPACDAILHGYQHGTRFGIRMDPADSLITAGDPQTQLTWMDAKCNGIAFTPRHGKAVEINALWYHALRLMSSHQLADSVAQSFIAQFWLNSFRGLYDVVHDDDGKTIRDSALRPNQIFAISLPNSPLNEEQQVAVVQVVQRELLTPYGLRTLSKSDSRYKGHYGGDQMRRDEAYHNGTVWPWLMGPFLDAYLRVNRRSTQSVTQARQWLAPLLDHFEHQACIGQISEIFDGDEPHTPRGCFAQAWSIAEVLRLAAELDALAP